jgi:hypothetical protein
MNMLKCVVFIVSEEDFDYVRNCDNQDVPLYDENLKIDQSLSELEYFFQSMEKWGGVDLSKVMHKLVELEDKSYDNVKANFLTFVEEV